MADSEQTKKHFLALHQRRTKKIKRSIEKDINKNEEAVFFRFFCVFLQVSLHTYNFCYYSNYRGITMDYKCVSSTYNSLYYLLKVLGSTCL